MSNDKITVRRLDAAEYRVELECLEKTREQSVSFLQSDVYGKVQNLSGKSVVYFSIFRGAKVIGAGVAVKYSAPLGMNYLYIPYGPVVLDWTEGVLAALQRFFEPIARELNCAFVRLDNDLLAEKRRLRTASNTTAKTASLQPRAEWLLDISASADDIFMGMHKHARYNIRLAERANARTIIYNPADAPLDDFYALMQTTAGRDKFSIFDRSYYQSYLSCMTPDDGFVVVTYIDDKPAATGLFVVHDGQAHYVFAGSSNDFRKIAPAYSVIWSAVLESKKRGCTLFNFGGVSDNIKGQSWGGVSSFKKRFGGYALTHPNPIDISYSMLRYALFVLYKKLR